jgi:hypothetical protein
VCRLGGPSPPKRALGVGPACPPGRRWRAGGPVAAAAGSSARRAGPGPGVCSPGQPPGPAPARPASKSRGRPPSCWSPGQALSGPGPGLGLGASHGADSRLRRFKGRSIDGRARSSFAGVIGLLLMLQRAKEKGHLKAHHDDAAEDASCMLAGHWTSTMPPQFLRCHCLHAPPPIDSQLAPRKTPTTRYSPARHRSTQRHQRIAGVRKHPLTAQLATDARSVPLRFNDVSCAILPTLGASDAAPASPMVLTARTAAPRLAPPRLHHPLQPRAQPPQPTARSIIHAMSAVRRHPLKAPLPPMHAAYG